MPSCLHVQKCVVLGTKYLFNTRPRRDDNQFHLTCGCRRLTLNTDMIPARRKSGNKFPPTCRCRRRWRLVQLNTDSIPASQKRDDKVGHDWACRRSTLNTDMIPAWQKGDDQFPHTCMGGRWRLAQNIYLIPAGQKGDDKVGHTFPCTRSMLNSDIRPAWQKLPASAESGARRKILL